MQSLVGAQDRRKGRFFVTDWNGIRVALVAFASLVALSLSGKSSDVIAESVIVQDDGFLEWMDDYDEAIALAKKTGQPVFLEFRCAP